MTIQRTRNFLIRFARTVSFPAVLLACNTQARSEPAELPGGFELGNSFEQAQQHANSQGWELVRISPELPGQWEVKGNDGAQIGLFVCEERVTSIRQHGPGDLDEFARIVMGHMIARRQMEPDIQVATFLAGATRISNVDVRFAELGGQKLKVQLSSTAGRLGISMNYVMEGECPKP